MFESVSSTILTSFFIATLHPHWAYNSPSKGLSKKQIEEFEEKHTALIGTSVCETKPIPPKPDTNAANTS